jgi:hypothetical protein
VNQQQQAAKEGLETVADAEMLQSRGDSAIVSMESMQIADGQRSDVGASQQGQPSGGEGNGTDSLKATDAYARDLAALSMPQLQCIALLARGSTQHDAAKAVGVCPQTVSAWVIGNEPFKRELARAKHAAYESAVTLAIDTTRQVMTHGEQDRDRVQAAGVVLKHNSDITRAAASATSTVVIDKLINALKGSSSDTIDADYVALADGATPALEDGR